MPVWYNVGMKKRCSKDVQEAQRIKAVKAIRQGKMTPGQSAEVFGVHRSAIYKWMQRYRMGGLAGMRAKQRGRKPGKALTGLQSAQIVRQIDTRHPDELRLPFALWTREAVKQLIKRRFGLRLSVWTAGRYLKSWGFTPQKPLRRAYERDPKAVKRWLEQKYPAIRRKAKAVGATIMWGDESGIRSDHQVGRSYGRKGTTPVIPGTGKRFKTNMISAISNRGDMRFMTYRVKFTAKVFIAFLKRLRKSQPRPICLIVDNHPVHVSGAVTQWVKRRRNQIELFFLPAYCPDLNSDEFVNNDVKSNAVGRKRPHTLDEMERNVRGYLRAKQRSPEAVKRYFMDEKVRYAAV